MGGSQVDTGVGFTSGPLTLDFTQGASDAWSFSIFEGSTLAASLSSTITGDLLSDDDISQLDLYTLNGGGSHTLGDNANVYFNNPEIEAQVVPEPASVSLFALGGIATFFAMRRRR